MLRLDGGALLLNAPGPLFFEPVEFDLELANLLLGTEPKWSPQRISDVLASRETTTVKLSRPVAVRTRP